MFYDFVAKFKLEPMNERIYSHPESKNNLSGVLLRFKMD